MSPFAFLLLCVQACLIQNVYSDCLGRTTLGLAAPAIAPLGVPACGAALAGPTLAPFGAPALAAPGLGWAGLAGPTVGTYGGTGIGNVAVAGELPVAGTTAVAGQVPIIGAVGFGGDALAAGAVSIAGSCGCGCGTPYIY
ncbi:chorion class CA protein ERA.1-like [Manduca sexta]|uniref:chorion class CA protein ERA.1-like n=1 Tax=Manduca sexta TaxID=7130 RepID=UPI00188F0DE6|nr:chorion class CA protein ERA.1-like [Manduca sexta]